MVGVFYVVFSLARVHGQHQHHHTWCIVFLTPPERRPNFMKTRAMLDTTPEPLSLLPMHVTLHTCSMVLVMPLKMTPMHNLHTHTSPSSCHPSRPHIVHTCSTVLVMPLKIRPMSERCSVVMGPCCSRLPSMSNR